MLGDEFKPMTTAWIKIISLQKLIKLTEGRQRGYLGENKNMIIFSETRPPNARNISFILMRNNKIIKKGPGLYEVIIGWI